jgi:predicted secreted protein
MLFPSKGFCNGEEIADDWIMIINKQDNGKGVEAKVGDVLQIELESLGSAGYKWHIDNLDANFFELLSEGTEATGDEEKIGAPVMSIWRFRLLQKGLADINMSHYRVWEGKEKASEHFHIKLTIN